MGKVRIQLVKRTAKKLISLYPERFTESFDHNKEALNALILAPSKRLRNTIAGYIAHQIKIAHLRASSEKGSERVETKT